MSLLLVAYLVTVAVAFTLLIAALWDDNDGNDQQWAVVNAAFFCGLGPFVILGVVGVALANYSHGDHKHAREMEDARQRAELAELHAREAAAVAAREAALLREESA